MVLYPDGGKKLDLTYKTFFLTSYYSDLSVSTALHTGEGFFFLLVLVLFSSGISNTLFAL